MRQRENTQLAEANIRCKYDRSHLHFRNPHRLECIIMFYVTLTNADACMHQFQKIRVIIILRAELICLIWPLRVVLIYAFMQGRNSDPEVGGPAYMGTFSYGPKYSNNIIS